jgi:hypothetical protein
MFLAMFIIFNFANMQQAVYTERGLALLLGIQEVPGSYPGPRLAILLEAFVIYLSAGIVP